MKPAVLLAAVGCMILLGNFGEAQESASVDAAVNAEPKLPVQIVKLQHVPASNVAESLTKVIQGSGTIRIVPEPISNSLVLLSTGNEDLQPVVDLIRQLDIKPAAVELDVTILRMAAADSDDTKPLELDGDAKVVAKQLKELEAAGTVVVLERLHLTAIDNQIAQLEIGRTKAMTRGTNFSGPPSSGRSTRAFIMENVGTIVTATTRVSEDDALVELAVEKSWVPEAETTADDDGSFHPDEIEKVSLRSTLRIPKDKAVYVGGQNFQNSGVRSRLAVIVTAKVKP